MTGFYEQKATKGKRRKAPAAILEHAHLLRIISIRMSTIMNMIMDVRPYGRPRVRWLCELDRRSG